MLTRRELLFAEELVSAIKYLGVEKIPFGCKDFHDGVDKLSAVFSDLIGENQDYQKVSIIFTKTPISGNYDRLIEALQRLNGRRLSFALQNPSWENALINTPVDLAEIILERENSQIPKSITLEAAKAFCEGAHIHH